MAKAMRHRSSRAPRRQTGVTGETLPRNRPSWHRRAEALRYKRLLLWRRPAGRGEAVAYRCRTTSETDSPPARPQGWLRRGGPARLQTGRIAWLKPCATEAAVRHEGSRAPRRQPCATGEPLHRVPPGWHRRAEALRYKRLLLWRRPSGLRAAAKPWRAGLGNASGRTPVADGSSSPDTRARCGCAGGACRRRRASRRCG